MLMYLLNGEKKALESVIKEQRIRIGRGLISITPVSEAGLVSEEDAEKALESKQKVIDELSVENESQKKEINELKAKLAELDSHVDDAKDVQEDNKNIEQTDTKEVSAEDDKAAVVQDEKKVSASKSKK